MKTTTYIFANGVTTKTISDQPELTPEQYASACDVIRKAASQYSAPLDSLSAMHDMVICVWRSVVNDTRANSVYSTYVADLYRNECPFQSALPCWSR